MHSTLFNIFFFLGCSLNLSVFAGPGKVDFIDSYFSEYDHPDTPGAAVLVMQNGETLFERGYGLAQISSASAVTPKTNFRLASLSKQFTATAILLLVQQKQLSLDSRLITFFPKLSDYASKITIRQLLNHTSGLVDYEDLIPASQTQQLTDFDVLSLLEKQKSTYFSPGSQYRYSNGGYVLLGLIVERITGTSFSQFLKQNIFTPLSMNNSLMYEGSQTDIPFRAFGYTAFGNSFKQTDQSVTSATRGDGGVYTSLNDWALWENAINENILLSNELQEMAFSPGQLSNGSFTEYGFGWMVDIFKGLTHQYHTGSTIGFRTGVERFPQKNLMVLVLINRANSTPWTIARNIAERLF